MLPQWDPDRLQQKIPFNLALIGGRRQGKSTAVSDLVMRMRSRFDLIVAFIGSAACNPVIHHIMSESFDPRFFYSEWNQPLGAGLLRQQEKLGADKRSILILMDDVILSGKSEDQLNHMAMRGRHFGVSLIMCAVSYTTTQKDPAQLGRADRVLPPDAGRHEAYDMGVRVPQQYGGARLT